MNRTIKKILITVAGIAAAVVIAGAAVWLIDGRSPQAIIVSHALTKSTMEDYERNKSDMTDKSIVEIPDGVTFPRPMRQYNVGSMQVFHMEAADESKPVVLYIHGGAYLHNFNKMHWKAMAEWAETTGCGMVTPNYPLLYRHTASDAHPLMMELYRQLTGQYSASRLVVMGDSAGGGFALALTQQARDDSVAMPARMVLISPWVDVLGGDDAIQEHDTFLNAQVLRRVGTDWAGGIDPRDPRISPLYGDMHSLPPTDIYTGTWEVFYTDILKTRDKMKDAGVDVTLHVAPKMGHVYPLWPCPEGGDARREISQTILQTVKN